MARRKLSLKTRRQLQRGLALAAMLLLIVAIIVVSILDRRVTRQFEGRRWTLPARVYAQPVELYVGQTLSSARFAQELARLGYIPTTPVDRPGTFKRKGDRVDVYVRAFRFSDEVQPARQLRVGFDDETITTLVDVKGTDVPVYRLDPLLIGSIFPIHGEDRIVVSPAEVPKLLPAGAEGRRGSQVRHAPWRQSARDPARAVRERSRRPGRARRQHADAAARQELLPRQPPHAATQDRGSDDGGHSRIAIREGGHHERLHQRDLSRPGWPARRARLRPRQPVLFRQARGGTEPAGNRADGRDRPRPVVLRPAPAAKACARTPQPRAEGTGGPGRRAARTTRIEPRKHRSASRTMPAAQPTISRRSSTWSAASCARITRNRT